MAVNLSETKDGFNITGQRIRQTLVTPSLFHSEDGPRVRIVELVDPWRMYPAGTFFLTFLVGTGPGSVKAQRFAGPPADFLTSVDVAKQLLGQ